MAVPLQLRRTEASRKRVPVMGISEWMCYHINYDVPVGGAEEAIDQCVEAHLAAGVDQIVWNCGRSTLDYWSDLPRATRTYEEGTTVVGKDHSQIAAVMERLCPLRRAIECCRSVGVPIIGRLCMNRHYGWAGYEPCTSRFASRHPEYQERGRLGRIVTDKLCYAIEDVRRERIDILLEVQRIGVDALVLDFCRQMPMLLYHDALVEPYVRKSEVDPRTIDSEKPEDYADWFQYRADVLTAFLRTLRDEVRSQQESLQRACPIIARVPDNAAWLMIAYGLDVEHWCAEDLVDATMLSPFPVAIDDPGRYPKYHCSTAHGHGKGCIAGIGSKHLIESGESTNTGFFHPRPVFELADRQYCAGADAVSLYQSESLVRMDYLKPTIAQLGDPPLVARRASELPDPGFPEDYFIGMDWHTHLRHSVSARIAGDDAL